MSVRFYTKLNKASILPKINCTEITKLLTYYTNHISSSSLANFIFFTAVTLHSDHHELNTC